MRHRTLHAGFPSRIPSARCAYIMQQEANPVIQNAAQGWPPCSSGCPRSDSVPTSVWIAWSHDPHSSLRTWRLP
eukprot:2837664-Prymnesium_polylepis.1